MSKNSNIISFSEELAQSITRIHRFSHFMLKAKADPFIKGTITFPQYVLLDFLASGPQQKMKDIAKALQISLPAATGLINRLVSLKTVKRIYDKSDRRVIYIAIIPLGDKMVENVKTVRKKIIEKMFAGLSDSERKTYLNIIHKVERNLYEKQKV